MYGIAKEGSLPRVLARCHPVRKTPWVAIVTSSVAVILLLLFADVSTLATVTSILLIGVFGLVCVCALVLRKDRVDHDHYTAPTVLLVVGAVFNTGLLGYTLYDDPASAKVAGIMLLVGVVLYFVNRVVTPAADKKVGVTR